MSDFFSAEGLAAQGVIAPSLILDMPNEHYHRMPGVSCSNLKSFRKSAAHYRFGERKTSPALATGTALHTLVLEPDSFAANYVTEPSDGPRRPTKAQLNAKKPSPDSLAAMAYWGGWDEANKYKMVLTYEDARMLQGIARSIREHPQARKALQCNGRAEASAFSVHAGTGLVTRSRFDFMPDEGDFSDAYVDIKTAIDAGPWGFAKAAHTYGYHMQAPFYMDNGARVGESRERFVFIAVEKEPPYAVAVYELDADAVSLGRETNERLMSYFAECADFDSWPAYSQEVQPLSLPSYAFKN